MDRSKFVIVATLVVVAFFGSYSYASSKTRGAGPGASTAFNNTLGATQAANGAVDPNAAAGGGCGSGGGCCGGSGSSTPIEGSTKVEGDVQKLTIDTSTGSFDPNTIKAKAGVPLELTFTQAPGGCLSGVLFPDFNISEDLTGGEKTIKLPALEKGEYTFFCQMQMISGKIVVE